MLYFDRAIRIDKGVGVSEGLQAIKDAYNLGWCSEPGVRETVGYETGLKLSISVYLDLITVKAIGASDFEPYTKEVQIGQYEGLK